MDIVGDFPRGKAVGLKADYSPPSIAEVKKDGGIPPIPIYLHDIVLN
jgi:hypothetical protein